jgi:dTDP-4-dehydrorhamnose reductase
MSRGFLVVGGDSVIGAALARRMRQDGIRVQSTTRRALGAADGLHLDLATSPESWPDLSGFDAAILCAGITRQEECRRDPNGTRHVNVNAMHELSRRLAKAGTFLVYPSTNLVFDGSQPFVKVDAPPSPRVEYGRQKADVEAGLKRMADFVAIARLTKVMHPDWMLLRRWRDSLRAGTEITAFQDYFCAPIALKAVVDLLMRIAIERRAGIWQASGPADISYANLALMLADHLGAPRGLVRSANAVAVASEEEQGQHTTLDSTRTQAELGFQVKAPEQILAACIESVPASTL